MPPRTSTKIALPKRGRPFGRFTQNRRFNDLRRALEATPTGLTILDIAGTLRVTPRSARRYLEEVKRTLSLEPVLTTPGRANLWRIKGTERGRTVPLRRTQAFALLSVRHLFDAMKGSALYDEIHVALDAIHQIANRPGRSMPKGDSDVRTTDHRFVVMAPPPHRYAKKAEDIDELFGATTEHIAVHFHYREDDGGSVERCVEPLAIAIHEGAIACIAHDPRSDETTIFLFDRMSSVRQTGESFEPPSDFRLADWLQGEFGLMAPGKLVRVVVEFDPRAADGIRTRRVHPTQKIAAAPDGRIRLSFTVPTTEPVKRWVLGFGGLAHVVEPPSLRVETATELRDALAKYGL